MGTEKKDRILDRLEGMKVCFHGLEGRVGDTLRAIARRTAGGSSRTWMLRWITWSC